MEEHYPRSCIDCAVNSCRKELAGEPDFCLTDTLDEALLQQTLRRYQEEEETGLIARTAAEIEHDFYCNYTRVEETIAFARKIGATRLGIASCIGLSRESRILAKILRAQGFEVFGVICKAGTAKKVDIGIDKRCESVGPNICNPLLQAELLNRAQTQLNIVMGLCIGHDSLFYRNSSAPVTTLVVKDRVLGHNPVAALYTAESYYKKKLFPQK